MQTMSEADMEAQEAAFEAMLEQHQDERQAEYHAEMEREEMARRAAGGREICPACGQRKLVSRAVCTLGRPGHPGAEFSVYRRCEHCDHKEL